MPKKTIDNPNPLRTPIISVLSHVDHGKTTLLDSIRGSSMTDAEAGAITQHIGITTVPIDIISRLAGSLVSSKDLELPGLLFIDTPGHQLFTTLRSRGGSLADIAILVVDINDGFQPQTKEALNILRNSKTPFIVCANKIDTIPGWNSNQSSVSVTSYNSQPERVRSAMDQKFYQLVGDLSTFGFTSDYYWKVSDFSKTLGIIPTSARTQEGIPDLLAVLMGLAQKYMRDSISVDITGPGKGMVLEVKEERGLGTVIDAILYDGSLSEDDQMVVGGIDGPISTKVRALFSLLPLSESNSTSLFTRTSNVTAASGIRIAASNLSNVLVGSPLRSAQDADLDSILLEIESELEKAKINTQDSGVIIRADTLGSLEALSKALSDIEVPIMRASVGDIAPRDISLASTTNEKQHRVILGFNVNLIEDAGRNAREKDVKILTNDVIYHLLEEYESYTEELSSHRRKNLFDKLTRPAHFQILENHIFRQSNPAIVGVEILSGTLQKNAPVAIPLQDDFKRIGFIKDIHYQGESVSQAQMGDQVSISLDGPTVGRQIDEKSELWVDIHEKHVKALEDTFYNDLRNDECEALSFFAQRKRIKDPFWGK